MCTRKGHLEAIVQIRQMMAEQKFLEAQKLIEIQLKLSPIKDYEILKLYFESLHPQNKLLPQVLLLELAEKAIDHDNFTLAEDLLETKISDRYINRQLILKLKTFEKKGNVDAIYKCLSSFLLRQFEYQTPFLPEKINSLKERYFKNDFGLNLKILSIYLLINDINNSEKILKEILITCVETTTQRGLEEKIKTVGEVLMNATNKGRLEIYQNFCQIFSNGINEKNDYKKLIEMIIFFEDFKLQVFCLYLLDKINLKELADDYSKTVKENKNYSFVYLEKFFPHLKKFFFKKVNQEAVISLPTEIVKFEFNQGQSKEILPPLKELDVEEDVKQYKNILKYQDFTTAQLCDLAVGFIQSEMPQVALEASLLATELSKNEEDYLKACYLKLTCQMLTNDFRAAVDTSIEALQFAKSKEDILSFLYGKAEAYIRLNLKTEASIVLKNIIAIDEKYRFAKERLEKLNEI